MSANSRHARAPPTAVSARTAARIAKAGAEFGLDVKPPPRLKSPPDAPQSAQSLMQSTAEGKLEEFDDIKAKPKEEEVIDASSGGAPQQKAVSSHSPMLNPGAIEGKVETIRIGGAEHQIMLSERQSPGEGGKKFAERDHRRQRHEDATRRLTEAPAARPRRPSFEKPRRGR
mmetsp:Transcript_147581/g.282904  ORF Transcript_147581/g.282904 Transcript_147581/m.282904 type:complete len:172 (-) Transcript_147581:59-574(-)